MDEQIQKYNFLENPKIGYNQTHLSWRCYWGLKLHFTSKSYDLFRYGGGNTMSGTDQMNNYFSKRERNGKWCPERTVLYRIGKNLHHQSQYDTGFFDCYSFFVYQFINGVKYLHSMNTDDLDKDSWKEWKNRLSILGGGWKYEFERDVEKMVRETNNFNQLFEVKKFKQKNELKCICPKIMKLYLEKTISLETMVLLDSVLGFVPNFNKQFEDPSWEKFKILFDKYRPIYSWLMSRSDDWCQLITQRTERPYLGKDIQKEVRKILLDKYSNV